jgi:hypothetical protein
VRAHRNLSVAILLAGFVLSRPGEAQTSQNAFATMEVLTLSEGPNNMQLKGEGPPDLVMRAWRENFNAHGFYYYTFYVQHPDSEDGRTRWELVPFVTGNEVENGIATSQGADCVLRDLRVLRPRRAPNPATVVIASRELKRTYADAEAVQFSVYELRMNTGGVPGEPGIAFHRVRTILAHRQYCDVAEAFEKELGIK